MPIISKYINDSANLPYLCEKNYLCIFFFFHSQVFNLKEINFNHFFKNFFLFFLSRFLILFMLFETFIALLEPLYQNIQILFENIK